jgi:soluble lytic murein transglycosylase
LEVVASDAVAAEIRDARYHLAETYLLNHEYLASAAAWEAFLAEYPDDSRRPQAMFMAARALHAANECTAAIPYYQAYLTHDAVLSALVLERIGDCHAALALGSPEPETGLQETLAAYRHAFDSARARIDRQALREKIAGVYLALADYDAAISEYDAILISARSDYYRAQIEYLAGRAWAAAGDPDMAHVRYLRAVDNYPEVEYAYLSLIELVDAGVAVDEFQRGLVDYYAGDDYPDAYAAAIRAFDRFLSAEPTGEVSEAASRKIEESLLRKALSQRALEQPTAALETLELLIGGYPGSEWSARAWLAKGATLALMGDNDAAIKTYRDLSAFFPADELAPQALSRAAQLYYNEGAYTEAAGFYSEVQASFPAFEDADEALWRAGLAYYRGGEPQRAVNQWQALLNKYPDSVYRPKTLYWLGKLGAMPEVEEAEGFWDQLVAADPASYYALRVHQVQTSEPLTVTRFITAPVDPPAWDVAAAQSKIQEWLENWTDVPLAVDVATMPVTLTRRLDFQRGQAFLSVGLRREALAAFDAARAASWTDPLALAQLSLFFREQGLYGLAARCASRLAGLWPDGTIHDAPIDLQRLAYPLAYSDLISREAGAYGLDPLLLAALIRQESLFEPVAESYAGARGLGQVMPATGEGIAHSLGLEDFVLDDLYRPSISIRFGAFYLSAQLGYFDDRVLVALAAYNGGPGNTLRWIEGVEDDVDLFVEVITATQSRLYLQRVYEQYMVYENLYRALATGEQPPASGD